MRKWHRVSDLFPSLEKSAKLKRLSQWETLFLNKRSALRLTTSWAEHTLAHLENTAHSVSEKLCTNAKKDVLYADKDFDSTNELLTQIRSLFRFCITLSYFGGQFEHTWPMLFTRFRTAVAWSPFLGRGDCRGIVLEHFSNKRAFSLFAPDLNADGLFLHSLIVPA